MWTVSLVIPPFSQRAGPNLSSCLLLPVSNHGKSTGLICVKTSRELGSCPGNAKFTLCTVPLSYRLSNFYRLLVEEWLYGTATFLISQVTLGFITSHSGKGEGK